MTVHCSAFHLTPPLRRRMQANILRLSVTERCNFCCSYCSPPGGFPKMSYRFLPSLDELADAALFLVRRWNVRSIKLTGGEPLLRPGLVGLVERLGSADNLDDISLTTNGSRLEALAHPLKQAGLKRVNVSLDTLDPLRFRKLCGGELADTLGGIDAALAAGLTPLKLNAVLRHGSWLEDVPALIEFAAFRGVEVRFIELMPIGPNQGWARRNFLPAVKVLRFLERCGELTALPHRPGAPAREMLYKCGSQAVKIGLITPQSEAFCEGCNRLRLDSRGRLRRCLMDPLTVDVVGILTTQGEIAAYQTLAAYMDGKQPPDFMLSDDLMVVMGG